MVYWMAYLMVVKLAEWMELKMVTELVVSSATPKAALLVAESGRLMAGNSVTMSEHWLGSIEVEYLVAPMVVMLAAW